MANNSLCLMENEALQLTGDFAEELHSQEPEFLSHFAVIRDYFLEKVPACPTKDILISRKMELLIDLDFCDILK